MDSSLSSSIRSLGFSDNAAQSVEEMLDWDKQYDTGKTGARVKRYGNIVKPLGLSTFDSNSKPGVQKGDQGKAKEQSSEGLYPVTIPKGNPQQGPRSRSDLSGLAMFDESSKTGNTGECRPQPKPRSPEQRQATREAQQAAQQQNQTFDNMPQQQVQDMAKQGGQAERRKTLPICPS